MKQTRTDYFQNMNSLRSILQELIEQTSLTLPQGLGLNQKAAATLYAHALAGAVTKLIDAQISLRFEKLTTALIDSYEPDKQP